MSYALVCDGKIWARGSKREMLKLRKNQAPTAILTLTAKQLGENWQ